MYSFQGKADMGIVLDFRMPMAVIAQGIHEKEMGEGDMTDYRILNGKPKATLLRSFNGEVKVIGPDLVKTEHPTVEEATKVIESQGWVISIFHLHGPNGRYREAENG